MIASDCQIFVNSKSCCESLFLLQSAVVSKLTAKIAAAVLPPQLATIDCCSLVVHFNGLNTFCNVFKGVRSVVKSCLG